MKTLIVTLSLMLVIAGLGCATLSTYVTPAKIDRGAVDYAVDAGVAEPNDYDGYPNLLKAGNLQNDVDSAHSVIQLSLQQQAQKDDLDYSIHRDTASSNYTIGVQREEMLFGEKGLLTLGLSMAGFGTLTGLVGLMRKRPGDVTTAEMEQTVAQATGKTTEELSTKERQMIQLVKSVQAFRDTFKRTNPDTIAAMDTILNEKQDTDTRITVAKIKKTV